MCSSDFFKGQLISKCLFEIVNFLEKTNENRSHSSKVEFISSFFGRNVSLNKSFRLCLTFSNITQQRIYYMKLWRASKSPFPWFHPAITNHLVNSRHLKCHKMPSIKLKAHNFLIAFFSHQSPELCRVFCNYNLTCLYNYFFHTFPTNLSCRHFLLLFLNFFIKTRCQEPPEIH